MRREGRADRAKKGVGITILEFHLCVCGLWLVQL